MCWVICVCMLVFDWNGGWICRVWVMLCWICCMFGFLLGVKGLGWYVEDVVEVGDEVFVVVLGFVWGVGYFCYWMVVVGCYFQDDVYWFDFWDVVGQVGVDVEVDVDFVMQCVEQL